MVFLVYKAWTGSREGKPAVRSQACLRNTAAALRDPEFEQSRDARNRQTAQRRDDVSPRAAAGHIRDEAASQSQSGADRSDRVLSARVHDFGRQ